MSWLDSLDAKRYVADILVKSGVPLQLKVASICREFARSCDDVETIANIGRLVYSPGDDSSKYREIDHAMRFSKMITIGRSPLELLSVDVLIECKSREDVSYFVFKDDIEKFGEAAPVASVLGDAPLVGKLRARSGMVDVHAEVVTVKIEGGKTPKALDKENLIYNAAGALYDFILDDIDVRSLELQKDALIRALRETSLDQTLKKGIRRAAKERKEPESILTEHQVDAFFNMAEDFDYDWHIKGYLPIVCVDGGVYEAGGVGSTEFLPLESCYCVVRKQGWPGNAWRYLANVRPEATVILTNPDGLPSVLAMAQRWFDGLISNASKAGHEIIERAPIAAARIQDRLSTAPEQRRYRSDWMSR